MAIKETEIVHAAMKAASECNARVFKNVRGLFRMLTTETKIKAGLLCDGSSDLIGWQTITITPDMIGKRIAVFIAAEGKTINGKVRPEQSNFIRVVLESGGKAGIFRNSEDMKNILKTQ